MKNFLKCASLLTLLLLSLSCKKEYPISKEPFLLEINNVQSFAVSYLVVPETNDFHYTYSVISVQDYQDKYGTDQKMISEIDRELKQNWEPLAPFYSFEDLMLNKGAVSNRTVDLEQDTDYYLVAFPYDGQNQPVDKVQKLGFKTASYVPSDIKFELSMTGSVVSVTPSNQDSYFWDYDRTSIVDSLCITPSQYFEKLIYDYEEYDFIDMMTTKGPSSEDITKYYDINVGDKFYVSCMGYNNGPSSDMTLFVVTYQGEGQPGKVERYYE